MPIKDLIISAFIAIVSLFATVADSFVALLMLFMLNTLVGLQADGGNFQFRKFAKAAQHLLVLYAVIFIVSIALLIFNEADLARGFAKYVTLFAGYFYLLNILRNSRIILPFSRTIKFMYELMSTEILKAIIASTPWVRKSQAEQLLREAALKEEQEVKEREEEIEATEEETNNEHTNNEHTNNEHTNGY